jgi:tRNA A37 threonylcarbamoyladenosine biosynthesis protein TsaE
MNNLEQIITDYLQAKETDYAIMINGDWGCGKTYYIRNILTDNIKKIKSVVPTSGKAQKKNYAEFKPYELVYVS